MDRFAEQLIAARKAAQMTQEQLAEKVHVTRAAVSHWENGRYQPDFDMIGALSKALNFHFEMNSVMPEPTEESAEEATEEATDHSAEESTKDPTEKSAEKTSEGSPKKGKPWRLIAISAAGLAAALILLFTVILPNIHSGNPKKWASAVDSTVIYRKEDFQAVTPRTEGKAYLTINTESSVIRGDNRDFWMYNFVMHEDQGHDFRVDQIEAVYFAAGFAHPTVYSVDDLLAAGFDTEIEANTTSEFNGGCPMDQTDMVGIGIKVYGQDGSGGRQTFTAFIPFPG